MDAQMDIDKDEFGVVLSEGLGVGIVVLGGKRIVDVFVILVDDIIAEADGKNIGLCDNDDDEFSSSLKVADIDEGCDCVPEAVVDVELIAFVFTKNDGATMRNTDSCNYVPRNLAGSTDSNTGDFAVVLLNDDESVVTEGVEVKSISAGATSVAYYLIVNPWPPLNWLPLIPQTESLPHSSNLVYNLHPHRKNP